MYPRMIPLRLWHLIFSSSWAGASVCVLQWRSNWIGMDVVATMPMMELSIVVPVFVWNRISWCVLLCRVPVQKVHSTPLHSTINGGHDGNGNITLDKIIVTIDVVATLNGWQWDEDRDWMRSTSDRNKYYRSFTYNQNVFESRSAVRNHILW